jgi:hypothetical protein
MRRGPCGRVTDCATTIAKCLKPRPGVPIDPKGMTARKERCARPSRVGLAGPLLLVGLGACASSEPPPVEAVRKPEPPPQRLAWMPLDLRDAPGVAQVVNERMSKIKPPGTSATVKAAVSMEVAQLAIECIQPTPACYGAVGRSLNADRLMLAELEPGSAADEKLRLTVVLYDVQAGTSPKRIGGTFADVQAARAGAADLIDRAADGGHRSP